MVPVAPVPPDAGGDTHPRVPRTGRVAANDRRWRSRFSGVDPETIARYASYGGIYVAAALAWLWLVDGQQPDRWDLLGGAVAIAGMAINAIVPRATASPTAHATSG